MTREEFTSYYLPLPQQRMALHLLPQAEKPLEEWRREWQRVLNSPTR